VAFYATDGHVDETAFLTDIGRHVLAHGHYPGAAAVSGPTWDAGGDRGNCDARDGRGTAPKDSRQPSSARTATAAIQPWGALWRAHLDVCPGKSNDGWQSAVSPGPCITDSRGHGARGAGSRRAGRGSR
jgi:hypothetical protein